jgi:hypothetical protein
MKTLVAILLFCSLQVSAAEHNWYRIYLASKCYVPAKFQEHYFSAPMCGVPKMYLPPWKRPKGAIFCRMEDYLTAKTKVWIKVGVK